MIVSTARRVARRSARTAAGVLHRVERRLTAPLDVLCYHRVAEPVCDPWDLAVSAGAFEEQVAHLRAIADIVQLEQELPRRRQHALGSLVGPRRRRVAITFDDGYVDNLQVALPILQRHDAPATVFVPTAFIGAPAFWWDRLAVLVLGSAVPVARLAAAFSNAGVPLDSTGDTTTPETFHRQVWSALSGHGPDHIDAVIDRVCAEIGVAAEPDGRPMTADELAELASHPLITIGAHTSHHPQLTRLDDDAVRRELGDGTRHLDALLGQVDRLLAYPHGNADRSTAAAAADMGFSFAFTTVDRSVSLADPRRLLPRRHPKDLRAPQFASWLVSA